MFSYAQNFEDVMLARLFAESTTGFYVDVGASDPVELSVTKHFYDHGWSGINIEPLRSKYELLSRQRSRDVNLNLAVGPRIATLEFAEVVANNALSTLDLARASELEGKGFEIQRYPVEVVPLTNILDEYAAGKEIDFLKVDVEGQEADVLGSLDLKRWRPKALLIEAVRPIDGFSNWQGFDPLAYSNWTAWEPSILQAGYVFAHFDGLNRFYVRSDLESRGQRLQIPPGVFDGLMSDMSLRIHASAQQQSRIAALSEALSAEKTQVLQLTERATNSETDASQFKAALTSERQAAGALLEQLAQREQRITSLEEQLDDLRQQVAAREIALSAAQKELVDKETVITGLAHALVSYQRATPPAATATRKTTLSIALAGLRQPGRIVGRAAEIARRPAQGIKARALAVFMPRLGRLIQHPPRSFNLPKSNTNDTALYGDTPSIAIVTPSYQQGAYVGRTIESVLDQNYPSLEYFVQDGASDDGTVDVLRSYEGRISGWSSEPDTGQGDAINRGFAKTSGEIMGWLNSDDLLLPGSLRHVANIFAARADIDVIYGHRIMIDESDQIIGRWMMPPHDDAILGWADYVPQETMFWRRSLWDRVGGRLDDTFRFAVDWDLLLRFRDVGARFERVPHFLGAFRIHAAQKTSAQISDIGFEEMDRLRLRALGRVPDWREIRRAVTPYLLRHVLTDIGWRLANRPGGPL